MNKAVKIFLATGLIFFFSCRHIDRDQSGGLKWGIIDDEILKPDSPQFLINKKTGQEFRVCLAEYMNELFPGIDQEIIAAVNIWASYLGRSIKVTIVPTKLPRATNTATPEELGEDYSNTCGSGFDVTIGLGPMPGRALGITGAQYSYSVDANGKQKVVRFHRYLFLKDFALSPVSPSATSPNTSDSGKWESLTEKIGKPEKKITADSILEQMKARNVRFYRHDLTFVTTPILIHEMGHVWGLCDQYEALSGCDPKHSTPHPVLDSMMGEARARQMLYLTDDDILGIRSLAALPGFAQDWVATPALTAVPTPIKIEDIEFIDIFSFVRTKNIDIAFSAITHVPTRLRFALITDDGSPEIPLNSKYESPAEGFNFPVTTLKIQIDKDDKARYGVKMYVDVKDASGKWVLAKTFEASTKI